MTKNHTQPKMHTLDATDKKLGRLASEIAVLLRGKDTPAFERHIAPSVRVMVENVSKMSIDQRKIDEKKYMHHTGHPGGARIEKLGKVIERKGHEEILRRAVYGMLPGNKLRSIMMSNLIINE